MGYDLGEHIPERNRRIGLGILAEELRPEEPR